MRSQAAAWLQAVCMWLQAVVCCGAVLSTGMVSIARLLTLQLVVHVVGKDRAATHGALRSLGCHGRYSPS